MVASVWRLVVAEKDLAMLVRECEINILPQYKGAPGLLFVWLWHRPCVGYAEVQIVSLWHSLEEMRNFAEAHPWNLLNRKQGSVIVPEETSICYHVVSWVASTG
jgi:heme-degrading monooxygenase HmoA